jgi:hypothetical protein
MPEFKACAVAIDRHGGPDDPIRLESSDSFHTADTADTAPTKGI